MQTEIADSKEGFSRPLSIHRPDLSALEWSKIRLARSLKDGDTLSALREVRKWAQLLASQQSLVSTLLSIQILALESEFFEKMTQEKGAITDWNVPDPASLKVLKATLIALPRLMTTGGPSTVDKILGAKPIPTDFDCAALQDGAWKNPDYLPSGLRDADLWARSSPSGGDPIREYDYGRRQWNSMPGIVQKMLFLNLTNISSPQGLQAYNELLPKAKGQ